MAGTLTASVVKNDTTTPPAFQNSAGTEIGQLSRAWVNFNGSTGVIRASFNVTSITKNGTGDYTVNMTNSLPDANYSVSGLCGGTANVGFIWLADQITARTTSLFRFYTLSNTTAVADPAQVNIAVNR